MVDCSDLIGLPYRTNGRFTDSPFLGIDCYGVAIEYSRRMGKKLKDLIRMNSGESTPELAVDNIPSLNIKPTDYIKEGTLLEMYKNGILHVGIALNKKLMIHATENQGVRISPIGFYDIKGMYEIWEELTFTED